MRTARPTSTLQHGFTLIELMVAMALGLMTTLIIAEVMLKSEGNRRTTTEGSDAQLNGALALYALQRDIQMAGYGIISTNSVLGCIVKGQYGNHTAHSFTLAPVKIDAGASAAVSDTITVLRSDSPGYAVPVTTIAAHANTDTAFTVQSSLGISATDILLAMPAAPDSTHWCTMFTVSAKPTDISIPHATSSNTWNPGTTIMPTSYDTGSTLAKITNMVYRSFAVSGDNLVATDLINDTDGTSANTIGTQVILLKAYYGKETTTGAGVSTYDTVTPTTTAGWQQVQTIRIAVVARSAQREKDEVTTTDPKWDVGSTITMTGTSTCASSKCLTLKVSPATGTDTEWKHYRYKVFDTVIPLRNMLWTS